MNNLALLGGAPAVTIQKEFRWPMISEEEIQAVAELLRSGAISDAGYGNATRRLEEDWAAYLGVEHALARVDGTAALHSALFAAGVGAGDEVIVQSYNWIATVGTILAANAVPVFADIDPQTLTLDPADVRRRITPRTRAIMVVHLWGHPAAMDELNALAREHNLVVVEDASHAHGGTYKGRKVGTLGDIGVFSLQASKALPAGEGGLLVTNRRDYFERALLLAQSPGRLHLHLQLEEHRRFKNTGFGGFKYRINPVNAVIARQQMEHFEERNEIRQRNMDFLTEGLRGINGIRPPYTAPDVTRGGYHGYPIEYKSEELVSFFAKEPELIASFARQFPQARLARSEKEILEDERVQLIVSAAIPHERAPLGIAAMRHGKDFMSDKPGMTSLDQLVEVRRAQLEKRRIYSILYSERFENAATVKAGALTQAGAIGRVIQTVGLGPHRASLKQRPAWFFDRSKYGGILCDIGSHQFDQFLFFTGSTKAEIIAAQTGNLHHPRHPDLEDFGDVKLRGDGGNGLHPPRYFDCARESLPYGERLVSDILNRTETAMTQEHCFLAMELALRAQAQAEMV